MKMRKIMSLVLTLIMICSSMSILTQTSFAWPVSGDKSCSASKMGGYGKAAAKLTLFGASEVSGNTATYYVDRYDVNKFEDMKNIYSVEFAMEGCVLTTSVNTTEYDISNHYINNSTWFSTGDNVQLSDTASGMLVGEVPAVGTVKEFTITASISVDFKYSKYALTDSCSVSLNVRIEVVDSSALRAKIGTGDLLQSSCWTSSTFNSYTTALNEAKDLIDGKTSSQSAINTAATRLDNARNSLVHNGNITECAYCKSEKEGISTAPISYEDIVYGTDPVRQCMDLYLPSNVTGDVSLILYLHGGGWIYGDKSEYSGRAYNDCIKYGVATLTISYRYTSQNVNGFDILDDIASALAKAKELGAQHGLNIKQMMPYGGSAGGHLTLFYAYARQNNSPIRPVAAFSKCGPTNLTNREYLNSNLGESTILFELGSMCGKYFTASTMNSAYDELLAVSPVNYVNANTVPTVICHGMKDITVPFSDAQTLDALLTSKGVTHYFLAYPNTNHAIDIGTDPEYVAYADRLFDQFVDTYLKNINPEQIHDYDVKTVAKTCTSDGYSLYTCKICGEYHVGDIDKGSHTPVTDKGYAATCTQAGLSDGSHCSVCGTVITAQQTIPAKGHTPAQAVIEKEVAPSCTREGSYDEVVYCSVCNAEISRNNKPIAMLPHTSGEWETVTPATYDSEGVEAIRCTVCGEIIETRPIEKLVPPAADITAKEGSGLVVDKDGMLIKNIEQGTFDLDDLLNHDGTTFEYEETSGGFGTGTKLLVKSAATGETLETYTLVFPGDVTGDGYVDTFDLALASEYINTFTEPEDAAFVKAADLYEDGSLDVTDLAYLIYIANFEE